MIDNELLQAKQSMCIVSGDAGDMGKLAWLRYLRFLRQWAGFGALQLFALAAGHAQRYIFRIADQTLDARPNIVRCLVRIETEADYFRVIWNETNTKNASSLKFI